MRKSAIAAFAAVILASPVSADVTVNLPKGQQVSQEIVVEYGYLSDFVKPRGERPAPLQARPAVNDGVFKLDVLPEGPAQYVIRFNPESRESVSFFTSPGDNLVVDVTSLSPLSYDVTGSRLMDDIAAMDRQSNTLMAEFRNLSDSGKMTEADMNRIRAAYDKVFTDFIAVNPESPALAYAVMHLEGNEFLKAYNAMSPAAKESPLKAMLEMQKKYVERDIERQARVDELASGKIEAPDFTFRNLEGQDVSLSSFRGKWVVIDFWGSWCRWCIKGFPSLKEAYAKYKDKMEVVGVACNDSYDAWKAALKKYELPWVNLYNPESGDKSKVLADYAVQGFPTKVIVNPAGVIVNITSGDDPAFYDTLAGLLNGATGGK